MAELSYPTAVRQTGPWLISAEELDELDTIVNAQIASLSNSAKRHLLESAEENVEKYDKHRSGDQREAARQTWIEHAETSGRFKVSREIRVSLQDGKTLSGNNFEEIALHPEVANSKVISIEMEVGNDVTKASLFLPRKYYRNEVDLSVTGQDRQEREEVFVALRRWIDDVQPPPCQQVWEWTVSHGAHWLLLWFTFLALATLNITLPGPSPYKSAAHELLAKGLTTKDTTKALEMILALESSYNPTPVNRQLGRSLELLLGAAVFCIMLQIRPGVEIGIGRGRQRIQFWTWWTRVVAFTIPGSLIAILAKGIVQRATG
jgi:hypothetical protein